MKEPHYPKNFNMSKTIEQTATIHSKYIQQHLANERTYLAWVRTAVTLMGVGLLASKLHLYSSVLQSAPGDVIARFIGLAAVLVGIVITMYATASYLVKRKTINDQTFIPPSASPVFLTGGVVTLSFLFLAYLFTV